MLRAAEAIAAGRADAVVAPPGTSVGKAAESVPALVGREGGEH